MTLPVRRLVGAVLIAMLVCAGAAQARPLRILVTNDDGWIGAGGASTPLIVALRDALARDGHGVTVVAPATDQSGNGTRLTFGALSVLNPERGVWTVGGSPGDSVFLGLDAGLAGGRPDLVVSGINPGGNYSAILNHSGTVGAAVAALEHHVPAIAVSIDGTREQSNALGSLVAEYTADLVAALAQRRRGALLPPGLGLNVNYPGATPATGTRLTRQDPESYIAIGYTNTTGAKGEPGIYQVTPGPATASPSFGSDWHALSDGKISITPIDADRTADLRGFHRLGYLTRVEP
jgi:5'/3'-nucleotidase SurE